MNRALNGARAAGRRKRQPGMITDAQRRAFFWYLKNIGYKMPDEKEKAYADLGITSTKGMTAVEMETILRQLRHGTAQSAHNQSLTTEERLRENYEQWRSAFFPEGVIAFGSAPGKRAISKKQQDFIITNALRVFHAPERFRKWMQNSHGCEIITTRAAANTICRGLSAMAARAGHDPAPPTASINRRDWELRHRQA